MKRCKKHPYILTGHKSSKCIVCRSGAIRWHVLEVLLGICVAIPTTLGLIGACIIWSLKGPVLCFEWWMLTLVGFACFVCALVWLVVSSKIALAYLNEKKKAR